MSNDFSQVEDDYAVEEEEISEEELQSRAEKLELYKQKKREAARRWKENQVKEKLERIENAKKFISDLKDNGLYDQLNDEQKNFLNSLVSSSGTSNGGLFKLLFGDNPQVGSSITLKEAFERTLKGKATIDFYVKRWAKKEIIVVFDSDPDNILNSKYTIEYLPQ